MSHRAPTCLADVTHRGPSLTLRVTMGGYVEAETGSIAARRSRSA
jgi:hypothetical protein